MQGLGDGCKDRVLVDDLDDLAAIGVAGRLLRRVCPSIGE